MFVVFISDFPCSLQDVEYDSLKRLPRTCFQNHFQRVLGKCSVEHILFPRVEFFFSISGSIRVVFNSSTSSLHLIDVCPLYLLL